MNLVVEVRSGGQALGMLAKGSTDAVAGILLDHDLSDSPLTDMDSGLSTSPNFEALPHVTPHPH